jgi:sirohydrochlorin ferrochelatase
LGDLLGLEIRGNGIVANGVQVDRLFAHIYSLGLQIARNNTAQVLAQRYGRIYLLYFFYFSALLLHYKIKILQYMKNILKILKFLLKNP